MHLLSIIHRFLLNKDGSSHIKEAPAEHKETNACDAGCEYGGEERRGIIEETRVLKRSGIVEMALARWLKSSNRLVVRRGSWSNCGDRTKSY